MREPWRVPVRIGSVFRLAYGLGAMLAPEWMATNRLAPTLRDHPDPRMNLRGFGGAQSGIALYTLATARNRAGARRVLGLNALVDAFDAGVSMLEIRDRGGVDYIAAGGVAINVLALGLSTAAAVTLRD
jgi:hypothetical protein